LPKAPAVLPASSFEEEQMSGRVHVAVAALVLIGSGSPRVLLAQQPANIAVLELEGKGVSAEEASVLTDKLRGDLINTGGFQVIERGVMHQILKEQGFQQTGCISTECAVEIGQLIGVTQMVAGSIGKIESTYLISIRLIDVATGKIVKGVQQEITGTLTDVLKQGIGAVVAQMAGSPVGERAAEERKPQGHVSERSVRLAVSCAYTLGLGWIGVADVMHTLPFHGGTGRVAVIVGKNYLGLEFLGGGARNPVDDEAEMYRRVTSRTLGGGIVWFYEGLVVSDFLTIAPGVAAGFWQTTDQAEKTDDYVYDRTSSQFGGVKLKLRAGRGVFHWFAELSSLAGTEWEYGEYDYYANRRAPIMLVLTGAELVF
jgi:TolB-like protein